MIRAGYVQSKHVKAPAVNILRRQRGKWLDYWCILVLCIQSFLWCPIYCTNTGHTVIFIISAGLPWGSLRPLQVGLAWLLCRPSWTSWNNAMFMLSSVKVQMLTLCSELVSGAVYINPPKSPSPLEGCFKDKRRLMFHIAAVCVFCGWSRNNTVLSYIRVIVQTWKSVIYNGSFIVLDDCFPFLLHLSIINKIYIHMTGSFSFSCIVTAKY